MELWCGAHCLELIFDTHGLSAGEKAGPNPKKGPFSELKGVKDNINNIIIFFKKHPKVGVMARKIATNMGIELMAFTPL